MVSDEYIPGIIVISLIYESIILLFLDRTNNVIANNIKSWDESSWKTTYYHLTIFG